jgi:glutathione S-transferase
LTERGASCERRAPRDRYLAEKAGKLIPADFQDRTRVVQWCFAALNTVLREVRETDLIGRDPRLNNYYTSALARPAWERTLTLYAERLGVTVAEIR